MDLVKTTFKIVTATNKAASFYTDKYGTLLFITSLITCLAVLTFTKIHGSSIGMYNSYFYGEEFKDENLLFGEPRKVRSDEWIVTTPLAISQSINNFSSFNNFSNGGQNLSLPLDIPTNHWSTLFKPFNWSFFVMPLENAFAFRWWSRAVILLLSTYLVLMYLTKKDFFLSLGGAFIFFFSPFIQWWYSGSGSAIEVTAYAMIILYAFLNWFNFKNKKTLILYSSLLTYTALCFVLLLYPPFQISVGLFILIFISGYILNNRQEITKKNIHLYLTSIGAITIFSLIIICFYYFSFKEIILLLKNTVYPGNRTTTGGNISLIHFFSGFFNIYFLDNSNYVPELFANKSEGASFLMFYPFLLPIILTGIIINWLKTKKIDYILISLCFYLILATTWIFFGLPGFISQLLKLTLVTENRMILGIGLANTLLYCYYLKSAENIHISIRRNYAIFAGFFAALLYAYFSINLIKSDYFYFRSDFVPIIGNNLKLILICLTVYVAVYTLVIKHIKTFVTIVLIYSLFSTLTVNPLYRGLSPIISSDIVNQVKQTSANEPESNWVVYDNLVLSNFLAANGIKTLSGISMYPKLETMRKLDPNGSNLKIYNRYGHITYSKNIPDRIDFKLITQDYFTINIDPCQPELIDLKVNYFVFNSLQNYKCLKLVKGFPKLKNPFYVYERE